MSTPLETGRISRSSRVASRPSRRTPPASHIAARAGTGIEAQPFRPVLRGKLLIGDESVHLRRDLVHGDRRGPRLQRLPLVASVQGRRPLPHCMARARYAARARRPAAVARCRSRATPGVAPGADGPGPVRSPLTPLRAVRVTRPVHRRRDVSTFRQPVAQPTRMRRTPFGARFARPLPNGEPR